ncbi:hypothetical protein ACJX0J_022877, partial [Zea mays]
SSPLQGLIDEFYTNLSFSLDELILTLDRRYDGQSAIILKMGNHAMFIFLKVSYSIFNLIDGLQIHGKYDGQSAIILKMGNHAMYPCLYSLLLHIFIEEVIDTSDLLTQGHFLSSGSSIAMNIEDQAPEFYNIMLERIYVKKEFIHMYDDAKVYMRAITQLYLQN